nr:tRNA dihydrouridine synthase DusB [Variibacter gotjawalensis]
MGIAPHAAVGDLERLPFSIGPIAVANRALLAPMSGVTDAPFRRLVARLGAGAVVSEMTASELLVQGDADAFQRLHAGGAGPHIVQLAGCEAQWMAEGARVAEAEGADVIDINMGCPARKVTNGYSGSALMRDLDNAERLIDATVGAVSVPVTLKMRLGWDHDTLNAPELAQRAEAAGVVMITVHGRTRCQFYKGSADWRAVQATRAAVNIPVVVNGDITNGMSAAEALDKSGADAVMIGRAAVGRPWLVGQVGAYLQSGAKPGAKPKDPSLSAQRDMLLELYDRMLALHGKAVGVRHVRKHLRASLDVAAGPGERLQDLRKEILTSDDPTRVSASVVDFYDAIEQERCAA